MKFISSFLFLTFLFPQKNKELLFLRFLQNRLIFASNDLFSWNAWPFSAPLLVFKTNPACSRLPPTPTVLLEQSKKVKPSSERFKKAKVVEQHRGGALDSKEMGNSSSSKGKKQKDDKKKKGDVKGAKDAGAPAEQVNGAGAKPVDAGRVQKDNSSSSSSEVVQESAAAASKQQVHEDESSSERDHRTKTPVAKEKEASSSSEHESSSASEARSPHVPESAAFATKDKAESSSESEHSSASASSHTEPSSSSSSSAADAPPLPAPAAIKKIDKPPSLPKEMARK